MATLKRSFLAEARAVSVWGIQAQAAHHASPHTLISSVTEHVIEYAPCPVLVVK
jgi:site-specific recombinase XerC